MGPVSYPRPHEKSSPGGINALLVVALMSGVLAAAVGLFSALDLLVAGEELTVLSDRAHTFFSRYPDDAHYGGERLLGFVVLFVSILRPVLATGILMRRRWGYQLGTICMVPCALLDVSGGSPPFAVLMLLFDAIVFFHSLRKPTL